MVVGPGSPKFDEAYFEVSYVRTYTTGVVVPSSTSAAPTSAATSQRTQSSGGQSLHVVLTWGTLLALGLVLGSLLPWV